MTNKGDLKLDTIIISKDKQKQGIGSSVMKELTSFADKNSVRIILTTGVRDNIHGTTSGSRLKKFYKRFGFVENKGRNKDFTISENMYRNPKNSIILKEGRSEYGVLGDSNIEYIVNPTLRDLQQLISSCKRHHELRYLISTDENNIVVWQAELKHHHPFATGFNHSKIYKFKLEDSYKLSGFIRRGLNKELMMDSYDNENNTEARIKKIFDKNGLRLKPHLIIQEDNQDNKMKTFKSFIKESYKGTVGIQTETKYIFDPTPTDLKMLMKKARHHELRYVMTVDEKHIIIWEADLREHGAFIRDYNRDVGKELDYFIILQGYIRPYNGKIKIESSSYREEEAIDKLSPVLKRLGFKHDFNILLESTDKIPGGLAKGKTLEDIAKKHNVELKSLQNQLNKGIEVESEHTTDESIAKEIAMDHLYEDPKYYDKLKTIEEEYLHEAKSKILSIPVGRLNKDVRFWVNPRQSELENILKNSNKKEANGNTTFRVAYDEKIKNFVTWNAYDSTHYDFVKQFNHTLQENFKLKYDLDYSGYINYLPKEKLLTFTSAVLNQSSIKTMLERIKYKDVKKTGYGIEIPFLNQHVISEAKMDRIFVQHYDRTNTEIKFWKNIRAEELKNIILKTRQQELRFIVDKNHKNFYVWDAYTPTHTSFLRLFNKQFSTDDLNDDSPESLGYISLIPSQYNRDTKKDKIILITHTNVPNKEQKTVDFLKKFGFMFEKNDKTKKWELTNV